MEQVVGGRFNMFGGNSANNVAQFNSDGSIDKSFIANVDNTVFDIEMQRNGNLLIGGNFETVNGIPRTSLARLLNALSNQNTKFDFDGDGKTDVSIFRPNAGQWWYLRSSDFGNAAFAFGTNTDKLVPADYTGDGKTDIAFWRESTGEWFILRSEDSSFFGFPFGISTDIPAPGDYDGDGTFDAAVFRPSTNTWFYNGSTSGSVQLNFGIAGDIPLPNVYSVE